MKGEIHMTLAEILAKLLDEQRCYVTDLATDPGDKTVGMVLGLTRAIDVVREAMKEDEA